MLRKSLISWNARCSFSLDLIKLQNPSNFTTCYTDSCVFYDSKPSSTKSSKSLGIHLTQIFFRCLVSSQGFRTQWKRRKRVQIHQVGAVSFQIFIEALSLLLELLVLDVMTNIFYKNTHESYTSCAPENSWVFSPFPMQHLPINRFLAYDCWHRYMIVGLGAIVTLFKTSLYHL